MTSKVLHIRIKVTDIASCYEILSSAGYLTNEISPSSAVRLILESAVAQQVEVGTIDEVSFERAMEILDGMNEPEAETSPSLSLVSTLQRLHTPEEEQDPTELHVDGKPTGQVHEEVLSKLDSISEPDIKSEVEISEEVIEQEEPKINISEMERTSLEELQAAAPQDNIIVEFLKSEQGTPEMRELYKSCLEVVYSRLPIEQWGTEKAQRMIQNLFQEAM